MSLAQGDNTPTRPRIEPGSPDPESDALTTRPVRPLTCFESPKTGLIMGLRLLLFSIHVFLLLFFSGEQSGEFWCLIGKYCL